MEVRELSLSGLKLLRPKIHRDSRGFFFESYREDQYREAGITCKFVQDSHSKSERGTLRGMHFQTTPGQDKLVRVVHGCSYHVAVDIRPDSPTFGRWEGVYLDDGACEQLFIPIGFAHGFCVVNDAEVLYKCSNVYNAETESGFQWNDPRVGIEWPITDPKLSERDRQARSFDEVVMGGGNL